MKIKRIAYAAAGGARTAVASWQDPTGPSCLHTSRWGVVRLVRR
jgi:hypothetical protein